MCKCLFCYKELNEGEKDFHARCARKFFGTTTAPVMDYTQSDMDRLAEQIIQAQTTLTGVQPKLSLNLQKHEGSQRLTIVGLWGAYIFKPQTSRFAELPENEDLTMHLAEVAGLKTAWHSLIRLADNSFGYLTRRMDRDAKGNKLPMEDFCQLTERQTEHKYRSSYEQVAKAIASYSTVPRLDVINYYEEVLFCWLTGNNDMHLKNFSLLSLDKGRYELSPAYDLLNAVIINPADTEELALTLNGKKKRITRKDFVEAASKAGISEKIIDGLVDRFEQSWPKWESKIGESFLSDEMKERYKSLILNRLKRIL
ncbi:MAG: HipA domain-containing protein [Bacteroidales bacterium]|nr:HipA domain-containing protein [Bacteroidales bacterium]